jgi:type III secretory pathway component EscV
VKKIALIIVLFMFLKPLFPVLEYAVNYEYISKVLCVNKAKPMMHCNGKCHLMKELAKAQETEKQTSSNKKNVTVDTVDLILDIKNDFSLCIYNGNTKTTIHSKYSNLYSYLNLYSIFHPPIFIS